MALTIGSLQSSAGVPKSVAEITKDAGDYEFNALIPLKYWLRTADALVKQAQVYMREGDDEMTFFLLFRHAHLYLSHLSTHPQFNKQDPSMKALGKEVSKNLQALDVLRPRINRHYEEYQEVLRTRQKRREDAAATQHIIPDLAHQDHDHRFKLSNQEQLRGEDNTDLAAKLAGQEFSKRSSTRRAYPTGSSSHPDRDDLAARMQAIRNRIESSGHVLPDDIDRQRQAYLANNTGYSYPAVPIQNLDRPPPRLAEPKAFRPLSSLECHQAPVPPPKPSQSRPLVLPPRPDKLAVPAAPSKLSTEPAYTFAPGAYLENGIPLRTLFLPPTLRTTFLRLAYQNTMKNVETCGFLAGTLRANALFVSALVVPKQTATSDTCEMTDESELFDYVDQHDLMILGWIHTHPTQTCFMSSRDLHTHSGYQMMLAESIALVCAPSKGDTSHGGDWGAYRLTDPPGKMAILQCDKPGIFHPHDVENIYTDATKPGHVMEIPGMDFEIVDLRE